MAFYVFINVNYDFNYEWEKNMRRSAGATSAANGRADDFGRRTRPFGRPKCVAPLELP
jgi:hypothetical protein